MTTKQRVPITMAQVSRFMEIITGFESCQLDDGECHYVVMQVENDNGEIKWRWKVAVNQREHLLPTRGQDGK